MKAKYIWNYLPTGLCIAIFLIAGLIANGTAQSYYNPYSNSAPQTPQEREELFKAFLSLEKNITSQAAPILGNPYSALQNPYSYKDPQADLEQANTYKAIQKMNSGYFNPMSGDNWHYWASMWLNTPQGAAGAYNALQNPYAYKSPQAGLDQADAYKQIQKMNGAYLNPLSGDNWAYWAGMWLNSP